MLGKGLHVPIERKANVFHTCGQVVMVLLFA